MMRALTPQSRAAHRAGCKTRSRKEAFALRFILNLQGTEPHRAFTSVCNNSGKPAQNDTGLRVMTRFVTAESEFPPTPQPGKSTAKFTGTEAPHGPASDQRDKGQLWALGQDETLHAWIQGHLFSPPLRGPRPETATAEVILKERTAERPDSSPPKTIVTTREKGRLPL